MADSSAGKQFRESYWPADTSEPVLDVTLGDALRNAARQVPRREALVEKVPPGWQSLTGAATTDRRWTYAELLDDAELCASWLLERFEPGQHICVWAPNVPEWVILQYGTAMAGMVLVTANPALRSEELDYIVTKSDSAAFFHTDGFRGTDMQEIAQAVCGQAVRRFSFTGWLAQVRATSRRASLPVVRPRDPCQVQYTSGTTGAPKGVLLHHMGMATNGLYVMKRYGQDNCVNVSAMPLFHTAGSAMTVLGCVTTLSTYVILVTFDPDLVLSAIQEERASFNGGVPTMIIALLEQYGKKRYDVSTLTCIGSGGSAVPEVLTEQVKSVFGCDLVTVYGQTEASPIICQTSREDSARDKATTVGQPLWNVEVRVVSPTTGAILPVNEEGEIQSRGYQTMLEYYADPQATREAIVDDGWLRTGDLGVMDERGYFRITGRLKDMIIRGGENIYPVEVENLLMRHEAVSNVAVFGAPDDFWGEIVAAAIILKPGAARPTPEALKQFCRERLSPQKTPATWLIADQFPLTGSGKVQKFRLQEMAKGNELTPL